MHRGVSMSFLLVYVLYLTQIVCEQSHSFAVIAHANTTIAYIPRHMMIGPILKRVTLLGSSFASHVTL